MSKLRIMVFVGLLAGLFACEERHGADFNELKGQLNLTPEQETKYDEIVAKYAKINGEIHEASKLENGKVDRIGKFENMAKTRKQQSDEMTAVLTSEQMVVYEAFVEKHSRKRPGYTDQELAAMRTQLNLTDEQAKMLKLINTTFEQTYYDAHEFYDGDGEIAAKYWIQYDEERKKALKSVFDEVQYAGYLDMVKDIKPHG